MNCVHAAYYVINFVAIFVRIFVVMLFIYAQYKNLSNLKSYKLENKISVIKCFELSKNTSKNDPI